MKLIVKVIVVFVVVAFLLLLVLSYLEKRENNSPSAILDDLKAAGKQAVEDAGDFIAESGLKEGAAQILEKSASLLAGASSSPSPSPSPAV